MTWTYGNDPSNNPVDAVRFMVADVDTTDQLITNEEINYLLDVYNGEFFASVAAARAIAAKFSRMADQSRSVGDLHLSESYSQKSFQYHHLADHLSGLATAASKPPIPLAASSALGAELTIGLLDKFELGYLPADGSP